MNIFFIYIVYTSNAYIKRTLDTDTNYYVHQTFRHVVIIPLYMIKSDPILTYLFLPYLIPSVFNRISVIFMYSYTKKMTGKNTFLNLYLTILSGSLGSMPPILLVHITEYRFCASGRRYVAFCTFLHIRLCFLPF